jgi:hypothetical protein
MVSHSSVHLIGKLIHRTAIISAELEHRWQHMDLSLVRPVKSLPYAIRILYSYVARFGLLRGTKQKENYDYADLIHFGTAPF